MNEYEEFNVTKENFEAAIKNLPWHHGAIIRIDDEEIFERFTAILPTIECSFKKTKLNVEKVFAECFFNGYFYTFKDAAINSEIFIENPNFGENDSFKGSTIVTCGYNGNDDGKVDITDLVNYAIEKMKENPNSKVKVKITGWCRQMHFNRDLLKMPTPNINFI